MGCDWIDSVCHYGYCVSADDISFDRIENNEDMIYDDKRFFGGNRVTCIAEEFIQDCWKIFCENLTDQEKQLASQLKPALVCKSMPATYETYKLVMYSEIVFGCEIQDATESSVLKTPPEGLKSLIARFVYLFNETNTFANIQDESEFEAESETKTETESEGTEVEAAEVEDEDQDKFEINMELTKTPEAEAAIKQLEEKVSNPRFSIGLK